MQPDYVQAYFFLWETSMIHIQGKDVIFFFFYQQAS